MAFNWDGPLTYSIGGLKYVLQNNECTLVTMTYNGSSAQTPGRPLLSTTDGASYKVPAGKELQLLGAMVWGGNGNDGTIITISQSDAADAVTNEVVKWKGYLGHAAETKYDWHPLICDKIAAEKFIIQYGAAANQSPFNFFIGCEMPE